MTDPLGLIGPIDRPLPPMPGAGGQVAQGPGFKDLLNDQIEKVNQLQRDATAAIEDLATGRRDDVESVLSSLENPVSSTTTTELDESDAEQTSIRVSGFTQAEGIT